MTFAHVNTTSNAWSLPKMPPWVTAIRGDAAQDVAFLTGAALSQLHLVHGYNAVPQALLRDRLALRAAEACVQFSGRSERENDLRDAVHLRRPGDLPGPAGAICLAWQRAVARPLSVKTLARALPGVAAAQIAAWLDAGQGAPMARAAMVLEAGL